MLLRVAALSLLVAWATAHTYHLGNCPSVLPEKDFDMTKFLGKWFVIEKTSSSSKDQVVEFAEAKDEDHDYTLEQSSKRTGFLSKILGSDKSVQGKLKAGPVPGKLSIKFPLNPGSYDYIVFMTDYDNYAGVFSCQEVLGVNRRLASILSRTPSLEKEEIEKVRKRLSDFGINPYDLTEVYQSETRDASGAVTPPVWDIDPRFGVVNNQTFF